MWQRVLDVSKLEPVRLFSGSAPDIRFIINCHPGCNSILVKSPMLFRCWPTVFDAGPTLKKIG